MAEGDPGICSPRLSAASSNCFQNRATNRTEYRKELRRASEKSLPDCTLPALRKIGCH